MDSTARGKRPRNVDVTGAGDEESAKESAKLGKQLSSCPRCERRLSQRDWTGHLALCCPYLLEPEAWEQGDRSTVSKLLASKFDSAPSVEWDVLKSLLGLTTVVRSGCSPDDCIREKESTIEDIDIVAARVKWSRERTLGFLHSTMQSLPLPADPNVPIRVLYQDEHVLLVDKPPGHDVAPAKRLALGSMVNGAIAHIQQLTHDEEHRDARSSINMSKGGTGKATEAEVLTVHRLDRDTSGCLCFALNKLSAKRLCASFQSRHDVQKEYIAVVSGDMRKCPLASLSSHPRRTEGNARNAEDRPSVPFDVTAPICEVEGDSSRRSTVPSKGCRSQSALTTIRILSVGKEGEGEGEGDEDSAGGSSEKDDASFFTLVHAKLGTGRTHQIRVHLASLGYPIVSDALYGSQHKDMRRQALHALRLSVPHPNQVEGKTIFGYAEVPQDIRRLCKAVTIDVDTALQNAGLNCDGAGSG